MKQNKAREEIAKLFTECLEKEDLPWQQGFRPSRTSFNPVTNTVYKNSNRFILYINEYVHHYNDPRWMTFKQASEKGYHIRKGEKGVPIEYWSYYDTRDKRKLTYREMNLIINSEPERRDDIRFISQCYTVFNAKQMDGIEPYIEEARNVNIKQFDLPYHLMREFSRETELTIKEDGMVNTPYYRPSSDEVVIPKRHRYKSDDAFFSDAFHEICHATAHESRLKREIVPLIVNAEAYAIEELRAEIGSTFICNEIGIQPEKNNDYLQNSQAYIQSWLKTIKEKPNALFAAIKEAEGICDYVLQYGHYDRLMDIEEACEAAVNGNSYTKNVLSKEDLRLLAGDEFKEVTPDEMVSLVNNWTNGNAIEPLNYYTFEEDGHITCADNSDRQMFMEEFSKEDYLLAFLWMKNGFEMDDITLLKHNGSLEMRI